MNLEQISALMFIAYDGSQTTLVKIEKLFPSKRFGMNTIESLFDKDLINKYSPNHKYLELTPKGKVLVETLKQVSNLI